MSLLHIERKVDFIAHYQMDKGRILGEMSRETVDEDFNSVVEVVVVVVQSMVLYV